MAYLLLVLIIFMPESLIKQICHCMTKKGDFSPFSFSENFVNFFTENLDEAVLKFVKKFTKNLDERLLVKFFTKK